MIAGDECRLEQHVSQRPCADKIADLSSGGEKVGRSSPTVANGVQLGVCS